MGRKVFGSFLSACAGTIVGAGAMSVALGAWRQPGVFALAILVAGAIVLPVWLLLVLPIYFLVPRTSILWRPTVCIPAGILLGAATLAAYGVFAWPDWRMAWLLLPVAALVGGAACTFAALTARYFHADLSKTHTKA